MPLPPVFCDSLIFEYSLQQTVLQHPNGPKWDTMELCSNFPMNILLFQNILLFPVSLDILVPFDNKFQTHFRTKGPSKLQKIWSIIITFKIHKLKLRFLHYIQGWGAKRQEYPTNLLQLVTKLHYIQSNIFVTSIQCTNLEKQFWQIFNVIKISGNGHILWKKKTVCDHHNITLYKYTLFPHCHTLPGMINPEYGSMLSQSLQ